MPFSPYPRRFSDPPTPRGFRASWRFLSRVLGFKNNIFGLLPIAWFCYIYFFRLLLLPFETDFWEGMIQEAVPYILHYSEQNKRKTNFLCCFSFWVTWCNLCVFVRVVCVSLSHCINYHSTLASNLTYFQML